MTPFDAFLVVTIAVLLVAGALALGYATDKSAELNRGSSLFGPATPYTTREDELMRDHDR